jgi:O-antigen/teichoic acid export membrane protein
MINSKILKNIFSLSTAEIFSKILVFITTAYLARTILTDGLGAINLAQSMATYLLLLITTGMDAYGVKVLAQNRDKMQSLVDTLFSARFFLSILVYLFLAIIVFFINKEAEVKLIIMIYGLTIFAQVNYLNWVYMGLEKMEIVAFRLAITSAMNLTGILLLVHSPEDTWLAALIIALSQILNAGWMIVYYIKKYFAIRLRINIKLWIEHFKKAMPIGLTFLITAFYNNIGLILVGLLLSTGYLYQTGILGTALKALLILMSPLAIYQQAFYPQLSRAITLSERSTMLKNYTKITFLTGSLLSVILFFYAETLIITVFGQPFIESAALLKILAPALILMYINLSFSIPLIAWGYEKKVLKTVFVAGLVNLILNLMFIPKYGMYTVAYVTLLTEFIVAVGLTYYIYKVVKKTYFTNLAILTTISVLSFGIPYLFLDINFILNISISFISFILLILATKQIEIRQIKSLFGKTNE